MGKRSQEKLLTRPGFDVRSVDQPTPSREKAFLCRATKYKRIRMIKMIKAPVPLASGLKSLLSSFALSAFGEAVGLGAKRCITAALRCFLHACGILRRAHPGQRKALSLSIEANFLFISGCLCDDLEMDMQQGLREKPGNFASLHGTGPARFWAALFDHSSHGSTWTLQKDRGGGRAAKKGVVQQVSKWHWFMPAMPSMARMRVHWPLQLASAQGWVQTVSLIWPTSCDWARALRVLFVW